MISFSLSKKNFKNNRQYVLDSINNFSVLINKS